MTMQLPSSSQNSQTITGPKICGLFFKDLVGSLRCSFQIRETKEGNVLASFASLKFLTPSFLL